MARPGWEFETGNISNNSVKGESEIGGGRQGTQGLYEQSATPKFPLGYRMAFDDGRVFRYAHFTDAISPAGKLVGLTASTQVIAETAATAVKDSAGTAKDYASTDNVTTIYLKETSKITKAHSDDVLAGGYFQICDNGTTDNQAYEGQQYRIRSNDYTASTSIMKLNLYDPLACNLNSEATIAITGCMYRNLTSAYYTGNVVIVGVPTIPITAGYYAWVQTWGPCCILCDASAGTAAAGTIATLSDGIAGAVQPMSGGADPSSDSNVVASEIVLTELITEPIVGFFISAGTDTDYVPVYLQIAP